MGYRDGGIVRHERGVNWFVVDSWKEGGLLELMFTGIILFWGGLAREEIGDSISLSEVLSDGG